MADLQKSDAVKVSLLNKSQSLTIRPRLYEYELEDTQVSLKKFLEPIGVNVIDAEISDMDIENQEVAYRNLNKEIKIHYDAVVFALGSVLVQDTIPGINLSHNIDTYEAACNFKRALMQLVLTWEIMVQFIPKDGIEN